jgi:hypothetical protein
VPAALSRGPLGGWRVPEPPSPWGEGGRGIGEGAALSRRPHWGWVVGWGRPEPPSPLGGGEGGCAAEPRAPLRGGGEHGVAIGPGAGGGAAGGASC